MAVKRLVRKFTDVVNEVEHQLLTEFNVTPEQLEAWRTRAMNSPHSFPESKMVDVDELWIDYEVQRDVLYAHVVNIMKKWDPRICSPGSACRVNGSNIYVYDAQHRFLAAALLGFKQVPCAVVNTNDPNFPSYAFEMLNNSGVKKLTQGDLHRNALVRYKNGSRDVRVVLARTMQDQFDLAAIDLQDKGSRKSATLCGDNWYFFSHFKYAQKGIEIDTTGKTLYNIISAIKTAYPNDSEINQGLFIGLYELHRLISIFRCKDLPRNWMNILLDSIKPTFESTETVHDKAKAQFAHSHPGATWSAPSAMANFLRELHIYHGGTLNLPYHGNGSKVGIEDGNIAPGLFPQ